MDYNGNDENLIKLAKKNLEYFQNDSDLAGYLAFLFSELAELDSEWAKTIESDLSDMESF